MQSAESERKLAKLSAEKQQMLSVKKRADGFRSSYRCQKEKIHHLNCIIERLKKQLQAKNDECAALQEEVEHFEKSEIFESLESQIREKKEELETLQIQLTINESVLNEAKQNLLDIEERYSIALNELKVKSEEIQVLEAEVIRLRLELETKYKEPEYQGSTCGNCEKVISLL